MAEHTPDGAPSPKTEAVRHDVPRVALVGRPNAGKSTLFNRLIGEDRSIVHDSPGTTRDAIDTVIETPDGPLCFVDTAGMRKPSKTDFGTEHYSVLRALDALEGADLALLVIDATVGATHQDQRLAERIGVSGCPAVVIVNKWDLVEDGPAGGHPGRGGGPAGLPRRRPGAAGLGPLGSRRAPHPPRPVRPRSRPTTTGSPTGALNRALSDLQTATPAPGGARIRYGVQGAIDPPTFTLFATARLSPQYLRYVERSLRERFALGPTPIKLRVRLGGGR